MLAGFAILALLGVGLLASAFDDDDDASTVEDTPEAEDTPQNLNTTDSAETLITGDANDVVRSQGGNDLVALEGGNDRAFAGRGDDAVFGGDGNDLIRGQQSDDQIFGGDGEDTLFGDTGDDTLYGDDLLNDSEVFSQTARTGFLLFDNLARIDPAGDTGTVDTLSGGEGDDVIYAGGNDVVDTGNGDDVVVLGDWIEPGQPVEITSFDPAEDALFYSYANGADPVVLDTIVDADGMVVFIVDGETVATLPNVPADQIGSVVAVQAERPELDAVETSIGTDGNDVIRGKATSDIVIGDGGDDRVFAREGSDLVFGGEGNDFLRGEAGDDALFGDAGADTLNGDGGADVLFGADIFSSASIASIINSDEASLEGLAPIFDLDADTGEADTLNGGVGDDLLVAGSNDVVSTGTGSDVLNLGEWVIPNDPVEVVDFTPTEDVVVYTYTGDQPDVVFAEASDGTAVLLEGGRVIARFDGVTFADLNANSSIILERLTA